MDNNYEFKEFFINNVHYSVKIKYCGNKTKDELFKELADKSKNVDFFGDDKNDFNI